MFFCLTNLCVVIAFGAMNIKQKPLSGVVSLKDMARYSLTGDYIFHGSPVKLEPGVDYLLPHRALCERVERLYLGCLAAGVRFALVRGWGSDQMYGSDFYVFADKKYRLVIYSGYSMGTQWHNLPVDKAAYLYAVSRKDLDTDIEVAGCAYKKLPIAARAMINQETLADAGFLFAVEKSRSTMYWWGVKNTDEIIVRDVLPLLSMVEKRNQR